MHVLLNHTEMFNSYIAIDPSMWWDEDKLLEQSKELLKKLYPKVSLFLAIANTTNKDKPNIEAIKKDSTENTVLIRPSIKFLDYLKEDGKSNLNFTWKFYKDNDHMTLFEPAVTDALRFLLR